MGLWVGLKFSSISFWFSPEKGDTTTQQLWRRGASFFRVAFFECVEQGKDRQHSTSTSGVFYGHPSRLLLGYVVSSVTADFESSSSYYTTKTCDVIPYISTKYVRLVLQFFIVVLLLYYSMAVPKMKY